MLVDALVTMSLSEFRRVRHLDDYDVTPEWVIHHLLQHEAGHRGQGIEGSHYLRLAKDLRWTAAAPPPPSSWRARRWAGWSGRYRQIVPPGTLCLPAGRAAGRGLVRRFGRRIDADLSVPIAADAPHVAGACVRAGHR